MSFDRRVDLLGVVGSVGSGRRQRALDLLDQGRNASRIAGFSAAKVTGNDVSRVRIDDKVEFAPGTVLGRFAQVSAVHFDARTVYEDVNRSVTAGLVEHYLPQSPSASREGCVVWDLQRQAVDLDQRLKASLGLSPREMECETLAQFRRPDSSTCAGRQLSRWEGPSICE